MFNQLREHEDALPWQAVGRAVRGEDEPGKGLAPGVVYRPVLRVKGMGDLNAPSIAEEVNLRVLKAARVFNPSGRDAPPFSAEVPEGGEQDDPDSDEDGVFSADELLQYGFPLPTKELVVGVYLDDLGLRPAGCPGGARPRSNGH